MLDNHEKNIMKRNFTKNTLAIAAVEFFWGLGIPVLFESTFLQLFLRKYGASNFTIGLLPLFFSLGIPLLSLFAAYLTSHLKRKKNVVVFVHLLSASPLILLGLILRLPMTKDMTVILFFIFYAFFSIGIGLNLPVWQNFLVKIFLEEDTFKALSVMNITQSLTKIISSFFLIKVVEMFSLSREGISTVFFVVGIILTAGSFFFLITHELPEKEDRPMYNIKNFSKTIANIIKNRNFLYFMGCDIGYFAVVGVISFYANYAAEFCNINPAYIAGLFVGLSYIGGIMVQILVGFFNLFSLKGKFTTGIILSLLGIIFLIFFQSLWSFLVASFLLGAGRGIRHLGYTPAVKRLSNQTDATGYFAVAPLLILPFSAGFPILNGLLLDALSQMGGTSYKIVFSMMAGVILISGFMLLKTDFDYKH